jgi:hypothetical protein
MGTGRFKVPKGPLRDRYDKIWWARRKHLNAAAKLRQQLKALTLAKVTTVDQAINLIGRRRDRLWFQLLLSFISKGAPYDESLEAATRMSYGNLQVSDKNLVMKKAMAKLAQPDVCHAVQEIYALRGFTIEDAVDLHVKHIKGELTKEVMTQEGVAEIKIPPSYQALKDFQAMIIPKQTTKVAVANFNMNDMMREVESEGFAPLEARIVGEDMNTDPAEDETEIDPFDEYDDEQGEDDEEGDDE